MDEIDIFNQDIISTWNIFKSECFGLKSYDVIREGIYLKFDFKEFLEGRIVVKSKSGKVIIKGVTYSLKDYDNEIEARDIYMKHMLNDYYGRPGDVSGM